VVSDYFVRQGLKSARDALRRAELAAEEGNVRVFRTAVSELSDAAYNLTRAANTLAAEKRGKTGVG